MIHKLRNMISPFGSCQGSADGGRTYWNSVPLPFIEGWLGRFSDAIAVLKGTAFAISWPKLGELETSLFPQKDMTHELFMTNMNSIKNYTKKNNEEYFLNSIKETSAGKFIEEYKGFRLRTGSNGYHNVMFVQKTGKEVCCGQIHRDEFHRNVLSLIRHKLPIWMTNESEPIYSPYRDEKLVKSTCAHGIPLTNICDSCAESLGSNRMV